MHTQPEQHPSEIVAAVRAAFSDLPPRQTLCSVAQLAAIEPEFTESSLRNLIFKAEPRQSSKGVIPGNGLIACGAVIRIGRKVLVDPVRFFDWVRQQSGGRK